MSAHIEDDMGAKPPRWQFDKKGVKHIVLAIVVIVVASVLVLAFQGPKSDASKGAITPPPAPAMNANSGLHEQFANPELNKQAIDLSNAEVDLKIAQGKSGFSGNPPPIPKAASLPAIPSYIPVADTKGGFVHDTEVKPVANKQGQEGINRQIAALTKAWGYVGEDSQQKQEYIRAKASGSGSQGAMSSSDAYKTGGSTDKQGRRLVGSMYVASARLLQTVNSDHPNATVRAEILTGPLKGAIVIGKATRIEEGMQIAYSVASLHGCPLKIAAIALDEKTSYDIVNGQYDGRYAARFVFPILLSGVKAYSQARAQTGTTVITINNSAGMQTPVPSVEQARNAMIAAGIGALETGIKNGLPTTPQVLLKMGDMTGVLFMEPVYEELRCMAQANESAVMSGMSSVANLGNSANGANSVNTNQQYIKE